MKRLSIVKLDEKYCDYLRKFDNKVPYNFAKKKLRPFVGVLFEVDKFKYFAPLSSPKPKHLKIRSNLDFLKIEGGKLGAINFNNMIPVTDKNIIHIDLNKKVKNINEEKYLILLKTQLYWLNRCVDTIYNKAKKLYDKYIDGTLNPTIAERCCNFKLLEKKCKEYNRKK